MNALDTLFAARQYSIGHDKKEVLLLDELAALHDHHLKFCPPYRSIYSSLPSSEVSSLDTVPFLPVRLFKELKLQSVPDDAVMKVLTSSGTTSQQVSRIAVDRQTSQLQTKALAAIVTSFIGPKRLPMIIIDSRSILQDRSQLSARGAGMIGLSNFGRNHFYALDEKMRLDFCGLRDFIRQYNNEPILIFGFTFMIWEYLLGALHRRGESISLEHGILIHGGGWKKLTEYAVDNDVFKQTLREQCNIKTVHNYYGMVEQVGSIYMECEHGFLHTPNFADIVIRDPKTWQTLPPGNTGVIETISILPRSYPGHALLTEDLGTVIGIDDCPCGRMGTRFTVEGRLQRAELRGCSDTHAYDMAPQQSATRGTVLFPVMRELHGHDDLPGESFFNSVPTRSFSDESVAFLDSLSRTMFSMRAIIQDPHLAALAYWLRRANISRYVQDFRATVGEFEIVVPRGIAFHVAPANVESIFFYSWALSVLAGNINIVRIPQGISPRMHDVLDSFRKMLEEQKWSAISSRNMFLTYPRDEEINRYFSERADLRIIWGGDETVSYFRALPAKPVVQDVVFGDKVSHAIINSDRYLAQSDKDAFETGRLFYNDSYLFDQKACSSPQQVYFIGEHECCERASSRFWEILGQVVFQKSSENPNGSMDKLVFGYKVAALEVGRGVLNGIPNSAPTVMRISNNCIGTLPSTCGGGFFFECFLSSYAELLPFVQANSQTLTCIAYSRDEMKAIGEFLCVKGIDRVVPVGNALNFSPVWDGYVLLNEMTKRISIG